VTGGAGADVFDYRGSVNWAASGMDTLTNFAVGGSGNTRALTNATGLARLNGDVLIFNLGDLQDVAGFTAGDFTLPAAGRFSTLSATDLSTTGAATQARAQFVYDQDTGVMAFDADGTGLGEAVEIVTIGNRPALTTAELVLAG
jgi:hypothetical protein